MSKTTAVTYRTKPTPRLMPWLSFRTLVEVTLNDGNTSVNKALSSYKQSASVLREDTKVACSLRHCFGKIGSIEIVILHISTVLQTLIVR